MPVSEQPLVERIARVLAGAALSSNAEGSDPSAGEKVDLAWREHLNQALAVLHTMREPDTQWRPPAMPTAGRAWSRPPSRRRKRPPRECASARETARRSALDARRLRPRVEPVVRRRLGPQRRTCPRSAQATEPAPPKCSGWSTPICSRFRRCCCSAERSATTSDGAACCSFGTSMFAVASLLCALAPSLGLLLAARALQGIGAALLLPNSLALLNAAYEGEKRGRAVGIWAAAGAAAAAVAPLIGGWLVDNVGWPAIFYINLPLGSARSCSRCASSPKAATRARAHRLCRRVARNRRSRRDDLRADAVVVVRRRST